LPLDALADFEGHADSPVMLAAAAGSMADLLQKAEALHAALVDAPARAGRLTVALGRHRKREKLVASTLATLRQLKLAEAAG
jgi:hypothetical protein